MGAVIETVGLRKTYGGKVAVGGLDLSVPEGGVFGFLGPNGSGKTTTIRMLLGLVRSSGGRAAVLGVAPGPGLHAVMPRIGSIVESPALVPHLTGRRNLELLGRIQGIGPRAVDGALARVGLAERADDRVAKYSLGMKQRVALAAALVKDPALLILDEPANGLDPQGMKELRDLVTGLGAEGRTVFVSSHLLSEIQLMCDRVAIVQQGRTVAQGTVDEVLAVGGGAGLLVRVADRERAVALLAAAGVTAAPVGTGDQVRVELPHDAGEQVSRVLAAGDLYVRELVADEMDLERVFLELTRRGPQIPVTFGALFGSEVRRVLSRRVVRVGFGVGLGIVLLVVVVTAVRSTGPGPGSHTLELAKLWRERSGHVEENTLLAMSVYVFILVVGIAATAVGADYRAGTVGTLLTWEPRRVRVAIARIAAIALVAILLYVVVIGVFVAGWTIGASTRGSTRGLGPDFWAGVAGVFGRCVVVVGVLAVVTAALAFLTRSTVGAVIVWFGYLIGVEAVLGQRVRSLQPGLLLGNLGAFLEGVDESFPGEYRSDGSITRRIAQPGPGLVRVLLVAAVLVALGVAAFRRRDVA